MAHGQWKSENRIKFIAVNVFHPFCNSKSLIKVRFVISVSTEPPEYAIIIIGTTISFAGKPKMKAISITPSSPKILPIGSKNCDAAVSSEIPPTVILLISHIISPAGTAAIIARESTNSVRSKTDRTITFIICGRRYGGNSSEKEEETPRSKVLESSVDTKNVIKTLSSTKRQSKTVAKKLSVIKVMTDLSE